MSLFGTTYHCGRHSYDGPVPCAFCQVYASNYPVDYFVLKAKLAEMKAAGDVLAAHVRNCGGCIGCDEAIVAWRKARDN
jgi:hypothetical protein